MASMMIIWPQTTSAISNTAATQPGGTSNVFRINATTDEFAVVMYAEEDCTITKIAWTQGDTSDPTTASPGTLRIGLQSVNTSDGLPSGTWLASGNGYVDKSTWSTADDGLYITSTLGSSVTLARGDVFAIVLKPQAVGTWGASNWLDVGYFSGQDTLITTPYVVLDQVKANVGRTPNTIVRSSTRAYGFPYESVGGWAIDNDVAGQADDIGVKFVIPAGVCDTYKINGVMIFGDLSPSSSFTIALYEGTSRTVLQSILVDSDQTGTAGGNGQNYFYFDNSTLSSLTAGTTYRLMVEAESTTSAGTIRYIDIDEVNDMIAWIGPDATYHWTEHDGTSYTDVTTRLPQISLLISDITEPSGGGGGYSANFNQGFGG